MRYTAMLLILTDKRRRSRGRGKVKAILSLPLPLFFVSLSPFLSLSLSFSLEAQESRSNKSGLNSVNPFINPRGGIGFKTIPVSNPRPHSFQESDETGTYRLDVNKTLHIAYFSSLIFPSFFLPFFFIG